MKILKKKKYTTKRGEGGSRTEATLGSRAKYNPKRENGKPNYLKRSKK